MLLVETAQDILEVKAAIAGFERLFAELGRRVPIQAQVTLDTSGRMLLGTDIASALTTLEALRVDVIGLNCSTGPEHMREPIRYLAENATLPVSCIPNAGLPLNTGPATRSIRSSRSRWPQTLARVRRASSACASSAAAAARRPSTSRAMVARGAAATAPRSAAAAPSAAARVRRASSSAMRAITLHQDPPPLLIGERVNAQGSRKVKRLLLADDYDGIARGRARAGGGRRARARRLRGAHRARRRSRADGEGRQAALDDASRRRW